MTHHHSRPKNTLRYDDEPAVVKVTGEDRLGTTEDDASDIESSAVARTTEDDPSGLEEKRRYMDELDGILCRTLLSIIRSGTASPSHLNVARQYLKDKGFTLPELAKRERMSGDVELLGDLDLPFGSA